MTISARRFTEVLRAHGHTVRIICTNNKADPELSCQKQYIPFFDKLVSAQGMVFAKPNKWVLKKGFQWADVIHFHVPFVLSHVGLKLARKNGKALYICLPCAAPKISPLPSIAPKSPPSTNLYTGGLKNIFTRTVIIFTVPRNSSPMNFEKTDIKQSSM